MNVLQKDRAQQPLAPKPTGTEGATARDSVQLRGMSYDEQVQMRVPPGETAVQREPTTAAPAAYPKLKKGDKGPDVKKLQELLVKAGAGITPDGDFGQKTKDAVIAFQKTHKDGTGKALEPDGVAGNGTWGSLVAATGGGQTTSGGGGTTSGGTTNTGGNTSGGTTNTGGTTTGGTTGGTTGAGGAATPKTLTNAMFAGDAVLTEVLNGKRSISGGKGDHIKKVQTALMNLGFNLPIDGADGSWGGEATEALGQFQSAAGVKRTGTLDAATMGALDQRAVSKEVEKTLQYGELFKDGLLDFTVGVGYDEDGYFDSEIAEIKEKLTGDLGLKKGSAADAKRLYTKAGMPMPSAGGGDYYIKEAALEYQGKPVNVLVRLVTYQDPEAKKAFLEAMNNSDVSLYTGHGRYGSGPDFDHKTKGDGNIWINDKPTVQDSGTAGMYHKLEEQGAKKELQNVSFDKKYKVWFFDGCNTMHYMKAIRQNKTIDPNKTDVFGWGQEIATSTTDTDVIMFIESLMKQQSAQKIINNLNKANGITDANKKHGLHGEGLGDNPNA